MAQKLIAHYVVKVFIDDDLEPAQLQEAQCNFCAMHEDLERLFLDRAEYEVIIEPTNEMPWNGCECVR